MTATRYQTQHEERSASHGQDSCTLGNFHNPLHDFRFKKRSTELHGPDITHGPETSFDLEKHLVVLFLETEIPNCPGKFAEVSGLF
jgi:hypothetical protein